MGYAVCYRDPSGATQLEDVVSLEAAIERVEKHRNEDGAVDARIFREVPVEVRTYYKIVPLEDDTGGDQGGAHQEVAPAASTEPPPGAMPIAPPPPSTRRTDEDAPEGGSEDERRIGTLFGRG